MIKVWLIGVGCALALVELYRWFENLTIPLSVYVVAGICLAIASNSNVWSKTGKFTSAEIEKVSVEPTSFSPSVQPALEKPQTNAIASDTISFTIDKPDWSKAKT